jgi:hypothetical protein
VNGSDLGAVPGAEPGDIPVRFAADGRLVVRRLIWPGLPAYQLDTRTGKRTLWKTFGPAVRDSANQVLVWWFVVTPDLKYYAYSRGEHASVLFVAQDLR